MNDLAIRNPEPSTQQASEDERDYPRMVFNPKSHEFFRVVEKLALAFAPSQPTTTVIPEQFLTSIATEIAALERSVSPSSQHEERLFTRIARISEEEYGWATHDVLSAYANLVPTYDPTGIEDAHKLVGKDWDW